MTIGHSRTSTCSASNNGENGSVFTFILKLDIDECLDGLTPQTLDSSALTCTDASSNVSDLNQSLFYVKSWNTETNTYIVDTINYVCKAKENCMEMDLNIDTTMLTAWKADPTSEFPFFCTDRDTHWTMQMDSSITQVLGDAKLDSTLTVDTATWNCSIDSSPAGTFDKDSGKCFDSGTLTG